MFEVATRAQAISPLTEAERAEAMETVVAQVRRNLPNFTYSAQNHSSENNVYPAVPNTQWTSGFWPGSIWLAYEATGDKTLRYAAQIHVQSFLHRIENRIATDHHDMGFLYTPSCVAAWKLVGDADGRRAALLAADQLLDRFQEKGQFIQAWGPMGEPGNYRFIIDCLLNLPLLHWASAESGDAKYREKALAHAHTTLANSIRPDNSTHHTFYMDPETGAPVGGRTAQGYRDESAWTRGQAWAISGMAVCYRYERDAAYLDTFDKLLDYYLDHLPSDLVPYWDLTFTEGEEPRDSSSASITACGLLEMADQIGGERAEELRDLASRMLASLWRNYAVRDPAVSNGFVLHGTYSKKTPYNTCHGEGVDECVAWGDYYYFEGLTRLSRQWTPYW